MPAIRNALWLGLFAGVLGAWAWAYAMAGAMGLDLVGRSVLPGLTLADLCAAGGAFWPVAAMWAAMAAAMMLPSFVPVLSTYDRLIVAGAGTPGGMAGLVAGYLGVWVAIAGGFAGVQVALAARGWLGPAGGFGTAWLSAAFLVAAGAYQFTPLKSACQRACLSPLAAFMAHWRPGAAGGAAMGVRFGLHCAGCCAALMALAFVGGAMNLAWMGLMTALMVLEKLPQVGARITRPLGAALIAGGVLLGAMQITGGGMT
ncbi:DUF2182 domain-containing protein [Rhodobacterales bacterium HKCCE2091]|nr:DUF2182 domain-containing protein [Rhodobacterales bacterium HKCCE2091]